MDIATGAFDFLAGADADDDGWLQYACVAPDNNAIYMADSEGILAGTNAQWPNQAYLLEAADGVCTVAAIRRILACTPAGVLW